MPEKDSGIRLTRKVMWRERHIGTHTGGVQNCT